MLPTSVDMYVNADTNAVMSPAITPVTYALPALL